MCVDRRICCKVLTGEVDQTASMTLLQSGVCRLIRGIALLLDPGGKTPAPLYS